MDFCFDDWTIRTSPESRIEILTLRLVRFDTRGHHSSRSRKYGGRVSFLLFFQRDQRTRPITGNRDVVHRPDVVMGRNRVLNDDEQKNKGEEMSEDSGWWLWKNKWITSARWRRTTSREADEETDGGGEKWEKRVVYRTAEDWRETASNRFTPSPSCYGLIKGYSVVSQGNP